MLANNNGTGIEGVRWAMLANPENLYVGGGGEGQRWDQKCGCQMGDAAETLLVQNKASISLQKP